MKKLLLLTILLSSFSYGQQSYYNDVNLTLTGTALRDALATKIISSHTNFLTYSEARDGLKIIDLDPGQSTNVLLLYGFSSNTCQTNTSDDNDHRLRSNSSFGGDNTCEWNREHTYPKSLGLPNLETSGPGSDVHHLRACDVQRNQTRASLKFIDGSGNSGSVGIGWYPGDEWKGDVARMMMYMYLRYGTQCYPTGVTIGDVNAVDSNMIDLLLEWNSEDPVSLYEDVRNSYLENASNTYGQGNRNPFIDNPNLATQIWAGPAAEDRWNTSDSENPSTPTNLVASNITNTTVDLNWTASSDNVAVTTYEIFIDGAFLDSGVTNSFNVSELTADTSYNFTVYAKDAAGNTSSVSNTKAMTTSNAETDCGSETFTNSNAPTGGYGNNNFAGDNGVTWTYVGSRDDEGYEITGTGLMFKNTNSKVTSSSVSGGIGDFTCSILKAYPGDGNRQVSLYINGVSKGTSIAWDDTTLQTFTVTDINITGNIVIEIRNALGQQVIIDDISWTCYSSLDPTELFISEYVEGSTGTNKAIEIANFTGSSVDLSIYSLKRNINGGSAWDVAQNLSGTLINDDVYVAANSTDEIITAAADLILNVSALQFNGNDPIGLFKNDVLIDIVGLFNGGATDFAADTTLRRKPTISSPNTTYTLSEWDTFNTAPFSGLGAHTLSSLGVQTFVENLFNMYPNPTNSNSATIRINSSIELTSIQLYNTLGQLVISIVNPKTSDNRLEINNIPNGMYIVKIQNDTSYSTKRLIVQ